MRFYSKIKFSKFLIILLTAFLFLNAELKAQTSIFPNLSSKKDTTVVEEQRHNLSLVDVTFQLSKIEMKVSDLISKIPPVESLLYFQTKNDSILGDLSNQLSEYYKENKSVKSIRNLQNDKNYWNLKSSVINDQLDEISDFIDDLDAIVSDLKDQSSKIEELLKPFNKEELSETVINKDKKISDNIAKIQTSVVHLRNIAIEVLDKNNEVRKELNETILNIDKRILASQKNLIDNRMPPLYNLDYTDVNLWEIDSSLKSFIRGEFNGLSEYFKRNPYSPFLHLIYILVLFYIFYKTSKKHKNTPIPEKNFFKKHFLLFVRRPVSLALTIGVASSLPFYENIPLIFYDLSRMLLIIPLFFLAGQIPRRYIKKYVYLIGIVLLAHLFYLFLPNENIYARFILAGMAILEFYASIVFYRTFRKKEVLPERKVVKTVLLKYFELQLFLTFVAFVSTIVGYVDFADFIVLGVFNISFILFLLLTFLIVINGLTIVFTESQTITSIKSLNLNKQRIVKSINFYSSIVVIVLLFFFVLNIVGINDSFYKELVDWVTVERNFGATSFTIGGLLSFFLVIYISILISKIIRSVLENDVLDYVHLESGLSHTVSTVVGYSIITIGVVFAMRTAGLDMTKFTIILSAFGVGIGFGLQNIFNNLVSGFILLLERPIKIGDTIEVGNLKGNVKKIGIRSSNIRTFDGAEIIVPNGNLISQEVINWTLSDQTRRIEILLGVSYKSNPHKVYEILMEILLDHPDIANDPSPNVFFVNFGHDALEFRILFWTESYGNWYSLKSEITFKVFDALKEAGIEIPFPQRDVHLFNGDLLNEKAKGEIKKKIQDRKTEHKDYHIKEDESDLAIDDDQ